VGAGQKIGVVSPSFHPMIGGVELYVKGIGTELAKMGYDVHVYTPDSVFGRRIEEREEVVEGIHVHRLHVRLDLSYRLRVWSGLREALVRDRPDLVHVYSHDLYARPAAKAAAETGIPLFMTTYGPFETHSDYGWVQRRLFRAYDRLVTPSLFKGCASVLVRYPEISGWVRSYGVPESKVGLEPSGIPSSYLLPGDGTRFRDELGRSGELILYLGRVSPQKGVQYAVMAMEHVKKRFPRAGLVIAGPDYIGYSAHLLRLAERLGVRDAVAIVGAVKDEPREREVISACDVFAMPSSFEGFSQGVMKAMAQGKPVVVTEVGGLPFEVDYGRCGMVSPFGDPRGLADRIVQLLESGPAASQMGSRGRMRARQFTFDRLASSLSRAYESGALPRQLETAPSAAGGA